MKKAIGIDIDGCLNAYHVELIKYIKDTYEVDASDNEYYMVNALNLSTQEENDFWKDFDLIAVKLDLEIGAKEIMDKLSKQFSINIITARLYQSAKYTESWLQRHMIPYDNLYFNTGNKLDACRWKNIQIMIEDNPDNAKILAENGIKVLLFNRSYNGNVGHENIIRCKNWKEIYSTISLLNLKRD